MYDLLFERLPNVHQWPQRWRRLFVLLLPISGSLWACYMVLLFIVAILAFIVFGALAFVMWLWTGESSR